MNTPGTAKWNEVAEFIFTAAKAEIPLRKPEQRRDYILGMSRHTWNLVVRRQFAHQNGNVEVVKKLSQQIKKHAKKDRKDTILNWLREMPEAKEKWQGVKDLNKNHQSQFVKIRNLDGTLIPPKDRAETIASYLERKHWSNPDIHKI